MKIKKYEQYSLVKIIIILFGLLELIGTVYLTKEKIVNYKTLNAIVYKKDLGILLVTQEERNNIYHNSILYIEDEKKKYQIKEDRGIVLKKNHKNYYELLIEFSIPKKYQKNDSITITVKERKKSILKRLREVKEAKK